jgi:PIN domain nuclease of toxin-antitoxin system
MDFIIDTHVILWMSGDDKYLSKQVKSVVKDTSNKLFISIMSFWEIAIKHSLGKLEFKISIPQLLRFCIENDIEILSVGFTEFEIIEKMPFLKNKSEFHKDPFDRIIIAQSVSLKLPIISIDDKFDIYPNIQRIW